MKTPTPAPYQTHPLLEGINHFYYNRINHIPTQGRHFSDTWHASARQAENPLSKASQHFVAQFMSLLSNSVEFSKFEKTPELLGVTIPKLPLTFCILMFFGSMMPARMHSEYLRAPDKDTNNDGISKGKDYRAIRDVIIRDVASISLFLFALDPVNHALLQKRQRDGALFSVGKSKQPSLMMMMNPTLNPRHGHHSIDYPSLDQLYALSAKAPETFAKLSAMDEANDQMHQALERYIKSYPFLKKGSQTYSQILKNPHASPRQKKEAAFKLKFHDTLSQHSEGLLAHVQALDARKALLKIKLQEALPASQRGTLNANPQALIRQLFELEGLERQADVDALTLSHVQNILEKRIGTPAQAGKKATGLWHTLQTQALVGDLPPEKAFLAPARETMEYQLFSKDMEKAIQHGDLKHFNLMADKAHNYQHFIDVATQAVMAKHPVVNGKALRYAEVFHTLKEEHFARLEGTIAEYRASQNLLDTLKDPQHGTAILEHLKALYQHSGKAMAEVDTLDAHVKALQAEGKDFLKASVHLGGKTIDLPWVEGIAEKLQLKTLKRLNVRKLLSESARNMRSPVDFMGYVFVAGVIGYFPVWLNQVVTDTEFRLTKAAEASKPKQAP
jgi:hypothetical protein